MTINCYPFDLPFLKKGSEPPNYSTGENVGTDQFIYKYRQAQGTSEALSHYLFFLGAKMNTLEISVSSQGLVEATTDWIVGEITIPSTSHGLTGTPTIPALSATTTPPLSNIDGGNTPFTMDGTSYPIKEFRINWNNNLIASDYNGSGLVDQITSGGQKVTGSFRTPVGKNLLLETAIHDFPQNGVDASYVFKNGTMVVNIENFKLVADDNPITSGPTNVMEHSFNWECTSASLGTAVT